jgi:hypothetical protein
MSDMGEDFKALRAFRSEQKRERLSQSLALFKAEGMEFSTNDGVHLVFSLGIRTYDVWPSTARWRLRGGLKSYFGMASFLHEYKQRQAEQETAFVERTERAFPHLKGETV